MKKILPYILSVSLFVYLIIVFTFASAKLREVKCEGLQVVVDGTECVYRRDGSVGDY